MGGLARYGRVFARSPGFAAVTVLILALGIGANTAILSVLNALAFRELPVSRPERLVQLSGGYRSGSNVPFSFPMFEELNRGQRVFSTVFGWSGVSALNVEANGTLFPAGVRAVTADYFSALEASPQLGRLIGPDDVHRNPVSQVAVISYEFWDRHFGRDPAIIGRAIRIEDRLFTIIGVTRQWFAGMTPGDSTGITVPCTASSFNLDSRALLWVFVTARLRDGVTPPQARAQLQSYWPELLAATVPSQSPGPRRQSFLAMKLQMQSAATGINAVMRSQFVRPLDLLMGISGLILLIVCVNLANLALARSAAHAYQMSTRIALGASRWQLIRQLLIESGLLSGAGAILALAFAAWGSRLLVVLMTQGSLLPVMLDTRPDWRVFAFTAALAAFTGLLIGLAPAWRMSRTEAAFALRRNQRSLTRGTGTLGKILIVTQIALSLVLLQGAGLFLRTLQSLRSFDPGFQKTGVLEVSLYPQPGGYRDVDMNVYRKQLIARVATLPGVLSAAFSNLATPAGNAVWKDTVSNLEMDGNPANSVLATLAVVSPDFFKTLGIPLLSGRSFAWTDDGQHPPIAIVDAALARRLGTSGGVTPAGVTPDRLLRRRIRFGVQTEFENLQIVGVARSARLIDLRTADSPMIYVPYLQHTDSSERGKLFVRAHNPAALAQAIDHQIQSLGHEYSTDSSTLEQASEQALMNERATAALSSFFAAVALVLAGIGLFGMMSYNVSRRTREIGIRIALGSQRATILRMILRETLLLTLAGVAIGLPSALLAARLVAHMLFGASPDDPLTFAVVSTTLLAVGAIAGYLPARRAMNLDPLSALRYE